MFLILSIVLTNVSLVSILKQVFLFCSVSFSSFEFFSQSVSLIQYVVLSVGLPVCLSVPVSLLSKRPSSFCLIHFGGTSGAVGRQKTTFDGSRPSMEDDLRRKTTFDGRRPLIVDTFDGRRLLTEDEA